MNELKSFSIVSSTTVPGHCHTCFTRRRRLSGWAPPGRWKTCRIVLLFPDCLQFIFYPRAGFPSYTFLHAFAGEGSVFFSAGKFAISFALFHAAASGKIRWIFLLLPERLSRSFIMYFFFVCVRCRINDGKVESIEFKGGNELPTLGEGKLENVRFKFGRVGREWKHRLYTVNEIQKAMFQI